MIEAYKVASRYRLRGPAMEQPEYNLFNRRNMEVDLVPIMQTYGLGTTGGPPVFRDANRKVPIGHSQWVPIQLGRL